MKTKQSYLSGIGRFGACVAVTLGLGLTSASALTSVSVPLGGKVIGNGLTINAASGLKRLDKAKAYTYRLVGTVSCPDTSTTAMKLLVPEPISLTALLNSFQAGSGNFLQGTYLNPKGTFPIFVFKKVYNEVISTPVGNVSLAANFTAGVRGPLSGTREGQVYVNVSGVSIVPPPFPIPVGTLRFDPPSPGKPGARLVISVKP